MDLEVVSREDENLKLSFTKYVLKLSSILGRRNVEIAGFTEQCFGGISSCVRLFCILRSEYSKARHIYEEVCLVDLETKYSGTESGRQYIQDL